jgi:uncharacterized protein YgiM (DUF1202 family)
MKRLLAYLLIFSHFIIFANEQPVIEGIETPKTTQEVATEETQILEQKAESAPALKEIKIEKIEGIVTTNRLNVRARPSTRFEIIDRIKRDSKVEVLKETDAWLEIVAPEHSAAWVAANHVNEEGKITKNNIKAYAGPGIEFSPLGTAPVNSRVEVLYRKDNTWLKIKAQNWMSAWVSKQFVKLSKPSQVAAKTEDETEKDIQPIPLRSANPAADDKVSVEVNTAIKKSYNFEERRAELAKIEQQFRDEIAAAEKERDALEQKLAELKKNNSEKISDINQAEKEIYEKNEDILRGKEKIEVVNNVDNEISRDEFDTQSTEEITAQLGSIKEIELVIKQGQTAVKGIIMPVRNEDRQIVDFALAVKIDKEYYPLCYVIGKVENLHTLYEQEIAITGIKKRKEGWSRPVFHMDKYKIIRK